MITKNIKPFTATRNACKVCAPLGASMAFAGIDGAITLLHGSQGCSTYIRRYMISHFKEPIDIASSNFGETSVIFGGGSNFETAMLNVIKQYEPKLVGIATTCLAETIGDDVNIFISQFQTKYKDYNLPEIVSVSTPSYKGTHAEGFYKTLRAIVETLAVEKTQPANKINIVPGMASPADIRFLKDVIADFGAGSTVLPDYSETLDGGSWTNFHRIPPGGTKIEDIAAMPDAKATIEFGSTLNFSKTAGAMLNEKFDVPHYTMPLPIGIKNTDRFFNALEQITGRTLPDKYLSQRGRLQDAYIDAHKYAFGNKAIVYGEEDLVVAMATFLAEIGVIPALCASGAKSGTLEKAIHQAVPQMKDKITVVDGKDFIEIEQYAAQIKPDLIVGNSKGFTLSRKIGVPLVRVGFPIHDRVGGARIRVMGYCGTEQLFDRVINTIIEKRQQDSPVGYTYM